MERKVNRFRLETAGELVTFLRTLGPGWEDKKISIVMDIHDNTLNFKERVDFKLTDENDKAYPKMKIYQNITEIVFLLEKTDHQIKRGTKQEIPVTDEEAEPLIKEMIKEKRTFWMKSFDPEKLANHFRAYFNDLPQTTFAIGMLRELKDEEIEYLCKNHTRLMIEFSNTLASSLSICEPDEEDECRAELQKVNQYLNTLDDKYIDKCISEIRERNENKYEELCKSVQKK